MRIPATGRLTCTATSTPKIPTTPPTPSPPVSASSTRVVEDLEDAYHQYRRDDALRLIVNMEGETLNRFDRAKLRAIRDRLETL